MAMTLRVAALTFGFVAFCVGSAGAQDGAAGDARKGRQLFEAKGCYSCHGFVGQGSREGPRLTPPMAFARLRPAIAHAARDHAALYGGAGLRRPSRRHPCLSGRVAEAPRSQDGQATAIRNTVKRQPWPFDRSGADSPPASSRTLLVIIYHKRPVCECLQASTGGFLYLRYNNVRITVQVEVGEALVSLTPPTGSGCNKINGISSCS
jgi:mono/diheme cytochrome c family protein